jgi:hypothetical protein
MAQDLVGRVQRLLTKPVAEWEAIDKETAEPQPLITGYVAPLAAIPAIAGLIGITVFGIADFRAPFGAALVSAIVSFAMSIGYVFVFAYIINALAPSFGAQKNFNQAFKVAAYAPTASWVSGIFTIVPLLGILALAGALYSLYLLFVGLPKLMKPPADKATTYTIVSILVAIVAGIIIGVIVGTLTPKADAGLYNNTTLVFERQDNSPS